MEFFLKNKTVILRLIGIVMLILGLVLYFWSSPQEGLSQNDKAAARIARMESQVKGHSAKSVQAEQKDTSVFMEKLKEKQKEQIKYLTILAILFGIGFVVYSFLSKKNEKKS